MTVFRQGYGRVGPNELRSPEQATADVIRGLTPEQRTEVIRRFRQAAHRLPAGNPMEHYAYDVLTRLGADGPDPESIYTKAPAPADHAAVYAAAGVEPSHHYMILRLGPRQSAGVVANDGNPYIDASSPLSEYESVPGSRSVPPENVYDRVPTVHGTSSRLSQRSSLSVAPDDFPSRVYDVSENGSASELPTIHYDDL